MANDDTAPGLTPEEIAGRRRLAAALMRPGPLADLSPDFRAQRDQQVLARLLLDPTPMASTTDLNAPAVPMPSGPSSAPYAPDSVGRLVFDATPLWPPTMERLLPGAAPILPPGLSRLPGPGRPARAATPSPASTADDMVEIPVVDGMGIPTGQTQTVPASSVRSLGQQMRDWGRETDDFVRLAADGATFGLTDKAAAGLRALTGDAPSYGEALKEERARTKAAGEKNPVAAPIGGLATGLGLAKAGLTLAKRAKHAAWPIKAALSGAEGAAYGAAHNAGHVDSGKAEDYAKAVFEGGLKGAFIGAALPTGSRGIDRALRTKVDISSPWQRVSDEFMNRLILGASRRAQTRDFIEKAGSNRGLANALIVGADARQAR
jgi:hypothetical protein